mmetsp:Transcript_34535/g.67959  ORF Transcript_34535/g.67959 Transcript_34535/m.67959 type:complete len:325 (+) Transcript_34535:569-1543(+)
MQRIADGVEFEVLAHHFAAPAGIVVEGPVHRRFRRPKQSVPVGAVIVQGILKESSHFPLDFGQCRPAVIVVHAGWRGLQELRIFLVVARLHEETEVCHRDLVMPRHEPHVPKIRLCEIRRLFRDAHFRFSPEAAVPHRKAAEGDGGRTLAPLPLPLLQDEAREHRDVDPRVRFPRQVQIPLRLARKLRVESVQGREGVGGRQLVRPLDPPARRGRFVVAAVAEPHRRRLVEQQDGPQPRPRVRIVLQGGHPRLPVGVRREGGVRQDQRPEFSQQPVHGARAGTPVGPVDQRPRVGTASVVAAFHLLRLHEDVVRVHLHALENVV